MMANTHKPSVREADVGGVQALAQPGQLSETQFQKKKIGRKLDISSVRKLWV